MNNIPKKQIIPLVRFFKWRYSLNLQEEQNVYTNLLEYGYPDTIQQALQILDGEKIECVEPTLDLMYVMSWLNSTISWIYWDDIHDRSHKNSDRIMIRKWNLYKLSKPIIS